MHADRGSRGESHPRSIVWHTQCLDASLALPYLHASHGLGLGFDLATRMSLRPGRRGYHTAAAGFAHVCGYDSGGARAQTPVVEIVYPLPCVPVFTLRYAPTAQCRASRRRNLGPNVHRRRRARRVHPSIAFPQTLTTPSPSPPQMRPLLVHPLSPCKHARRVIHASTSHSSPFCAPASPPSVPYIFSLHRA